MFPIAKPFEIYSIRSPFKHLRMSCLCTHPLYRVCKIPVGRLGETPRGRRWTTYGELGPLWRPTASACTSHSHPLDPPSESEIVRVSCLSCRFPILHQCRFGSLHLFIRLPFESGWAYHPLACIHQRAHTQSQSKLSTTVLIEQNVFQFSGEIKGGKEKGSCFWQWRGRKGSSKLNVILNDLRCTDSNVWACLLSSGTERKQSTGVEQKHYPSPWSRREGDKPPSLQFNSYVAWSFPMEIICPPTINVCLMWFYKSNIIWVGMTDGTSLLQLVRFLNQAIYKRRLSIEPPPPLFWLCFPSAMCGTNACHPLLAFLFLRLSKYKSQLHQNMSLKTCQNISS